MADGGDDIVQSIKFVVEDVDFSKVMAESQVFVKKLEAQYSKLNFPSVKIDYSRLTKGASATAKSADGAAKSIDGATAAITAMNAVSTAATAKSLVGASTAAKSLVVQTEKAVVAQEDLNKTVKEFIPLQRDPKTGRYLPSGVSAAPPEPPPPAPIVAAPREPLKRDPKTGRMLPRGVSPTTIPEPPPPPKVAAPPPGATLGRDPKTGRFYKLPKPVELPPDPPAPPVIAKPPPGATLGRDPKTGRIFRLPKPVDVPPEVQGSPEMQGPPKPPPKPVVLPPRPRAAPLPPEPLLTPAEAAEERERRRAASLKDLGRIGFGKPTEPDRASRFKAGENFDAFGNVIPPTPPKPPKPPGGGKGGGRGSDPFDALRDSARSLIPILGQAGVSLGALSPVLTAAGAGATALAVALTGALIVAFEKAGDAANDAANRLGNFAGGTAKGKEAFKGLEDISKKLGVSATGLAPPLEQLLKITKGNIPVSTDILETMVKGATKADRVPADQATKGITAFLASTEKQGLADETALKSFADQFPKLSESLFKSIEQIAPGQLEKGFVGAGTVTQALARPEFKADVDNKAIEEAAQASESIGAAFDRLKASAERLATALSGGTVVITALDAVSAFFDSIKEKIDGLSTQAKEKLLGGAVGGAIGGAGLGFAMGGPVGAGAGAIIGAGAGAITGAGVGAATDAIRGPEAVADEKAAAATAGVDALGNSVSKLGDASSDAAGKVGLVQKQFAARGATISRQQAELDLEFLPREQEQQTKRNVLNVDRAELSIKQAEIGRLDAQKGVEQAALSVPTAQVGLADAHKQVELAALSSRTALLAMGDAAKQMAMALLAPRQAMVARQQAENQLDTIRQQNALRRLAKEGKGEGDPDFDLAQQRLRRAQEESADIAERQAEVALEVAKVNEKYAGQEAAKAELAQKRAAIELKYSYLDEAKAEMAAKRAEIELKYAHLDEPKAKLAAEQAEIAIRSAEIEKGDSTLKLAKDSAGQPIARDLALLRYQQALWEEEKAQTNLQDQILAVLKGIAEYQQKQKDAKDAKEKAEKDEKKVEDKRGEIEKDKPRKEELEKALEKEQKLPPGFPLKDQRTEQIEKELKSLTEKEAELKTAERTAAESRKIANEKAAEAQQAADRLKKLYSQPSPLKGTPQDRAPPEREPEQPRQQTVRPPGAPETKYDPTKPLPRDAPPPGPNERDIRIFGGREKETYRVPSETPPPPPPPPATVAPPIATDQQILDGLRDALKTLQATPPPPPTQQPPPTAPLPQPGAPDFIGPVQQQPQPGAALDTNQLQASLQGVGTAADTAKTSLEGVGTSVDTMKTSIEGVGTSVDTMKTSLEGVGTSVDTMKTAMDGVGASTDTAKTALEGVGAATDTAKTALEGVGTSAGTAASGLDSAATAASNFASAAEAAAASLASIRPSGGGAQAASGGLIHGPGTGTSDSIPAWLSHGEFVQSARATRFWGTDFMRAINSLKMPKFYAGGFAGMKSGMAGLMSFGLPRVHPMDSGMSTRTISMEQEQPNFGTIDLRTDYGSVQMQGTKSAVDQLSKMAVTKRITSTGRKPGFIG